MAEKWQDYLYIGIPDMDHDGDRDLQDYWLYQDQLRRTNEERAPAEDDEDDDRWRDDPDDDDEDLDIDPDDYDSAEEYIEALEDAIFDKRMAASVRGFRTSAAGDFDDDEDYDDDEDDDGLFDDPDDDDDDDDDVYIDPYVDELREVTSNGEKSGEEDGEGSEQYIRYRKAAAANELENAAKGEFYGIAEELVVCRFIVGSGALAAQYLTMRGIYLYAQAIKDHFKLPFDIPDEKDKAKTNFGSLLLFLAEDNVPNAIKIWEWCLDTFQPYMRYADNGSDITSSVLLSLRDYPDEFPAAIIKRMAASPSFAEKLITNCDGYLRSVVDLVLTAFECGHTETAKKIMECALANPASDVTDKIEYIESCIDKCLREDGLEPAELFLTHVFPIVFDESDVRIKNRIAKWRKSLTDFIEYKEKNSKKYAYSRKNAWREKYRDSDIDPTRYGSEEEYLSVVNEKKYGWRRNCWNKFGIDPEAFETRDEYDIAIRAEYERERKALEEERAPDPRDTRIYRFCKVSINYPDKPYYYYLTGEAELEVGDRVVVPFGIENEMKEAVVTSVGKCFGSAFPCRIEKVKTVAAKLRR